MSISNKIKHKLQRRIDRHRRVRAKIAGDAKTPRLCVSRSNRHIVAQLIDDSKGVTLAVCRDADIKKKPAETGKSEGKLAAKIAVAFGVGTAIAQKAKEAGIKKVVFDRGGHLYHGRVKGLAQGAREGGLEF